MTEDTPTPPPAASRPRSYDLRDPKELARLLHETLGYARVSLFKKDGTDLVGREWAFIALRNAVDRGYKLVPPDGGALIAAQSACTAWQSVFLSIEAHLLDRIAMKDPASPQTYLEIIRADVEEVNRYSRQIVASRWADSARMQQQITELEAQLADMTRKYAPGHTDLMISPEAIDRALAEKE